MTRKRDHAGASSPKYNCRTVGCGNHLRRLTVGNDAARPHDRHSAAQPGYERNIVLDHEHGDVALGIDVQQELPQLFGFGFGQARRPVRRAKSACGFETMARAISSRRWSPSDKAPARRLRLAGKPDRFESDQAPRAWRHALRGPVDKMIEASCHRMDDGVAAAADDHVVEA